ncbi:MAG: peptidylprolyl isomerase [Candidatus Eiseniibacteriota bacterium]
MFAPVNSHPSITSRRIARGTLGVVILCLLAPLARAADPMPAPAASAPAKPADAAPATRFLPDSTVVATFDGRNITAREYVWTWFNSDPAGRPSTDSLGRAEFLKSLMSKQVLGAAARKAGYDIGYEGRVIMREFTQRELSNILFQRAVLDSVQISEADVLHVYEQLHRAPHLRRILFVNRATADRVRVDLVSGRIRWADAVKKYSKATDTRGPDGDFGWVVRTSLDYDLGEIIFGLKPGGLSPVFEDENGPQIVQCLEYRTVSAPSLESVRKTIERQIAGSRTQMYAQRMQRVLSDHIGFTPDTANINWACRRFPSPHKVDRGEAGTTMSLDASEPDIPEQDTSRVVARWKNGSITLGQFLYHYTAITPVLRPNASTPEALTTQVANVVLEPLKEQVALDRGYDKDPLVVAAVSKRYERILVERMYSDSVLAHVQVTKAERRQEYDAHPKDYMVPEQRVFATIMRGSQKSADSLVAALRSGARASEVLIADSLAGGVTGAIHVMKADEHGVFRKIVFEEMKGGDVTTTPAAAGRVVVIQLLQVAPERRQTYEEAEDAINDVLLQRKAEGALEALLKRLSRGHTIVTHPELLMGIRLVDPVA